MTATLDNPPRNFMTGRMVAELDELTRELEADGIFITHYDLEEIVRRAKAAPTVSRGVVGGALRAVGAASRVPGVDAALTRTPTAGMVLLQRIHDLFVRMQRMDEIGLPAMSVGIIPGAGGTQPMARALGARRRSS